MRAHPRSIAFRLLPGALMLSAWAACALPAHAAGQLYHVAARQVLPGPVRWDYLSVDAAHHRLFLTRGDHVDVYDTQGKTVVGSVSGTAGVHGVAVAPERDRGYTSNGASDSVTVFALSSLKEVATVKVGARPDAIVYDAATGRVFVANAKDKSLSVIDADSNALIGTIALPGGPETAVVDGKGKLFVALEDANAIAAVDTRSMLVLQKFDVSAACEEPAGLAIDTAAQRLYAGCHNGKMAIVDATSGKLLAAPAIGHGNDAIAFDPARKLAFASNGDGTLTVVDAGAPYAVVQTLATMARARTMALDPLTHALYLVSAQAASEAPQPAKGRPALQAGTFTLLTVAPQ